MSIFIPTWIFWILGFLAVAVILVLACVGAFLLFVLKDFHFGM